MMYELSKIKFNILFADNFSSMTRTYIITCVTYFRELINTHCVEIFVK